MATAFAGISESSDSDSPGERDAMVNFSSKPPFMALVDTTSRSIYRGDMIGKWDEYEQAERVQRVTNMTESANENATLWEFSQEERKTFLHGFYDRRVFRGSEVAESAVLNKMSLKAWKVLSHKALY